MSIRVDTQAIDTFPRLLFHHARIRGDKIAMREKSLGIWQCWNWRVVAEQVLALAGGLAALGFKRGDNLAIIGDNRPRLYMAMAAAQCLGGVPVPLYQDAIADEMRFIMDDADIRFAIAEDQEQVDKLLAIKDYLPRLSHIVFDDPRGMRHYRQPFIHDIETLLNNGRAYSTTHPTLIVDAIAQGAADDVSIILYTSGTTGRPKGVCMTHRAFINAAQGGIVFDRLTADEEVLSYLPMAWVGDYLFSFAQAMVAGFTINCPESYTTVMTDLREIGPSYYFAPPRIFENLLTQVMIRMENACSLKRRMFHFFMRVAERFGAQILDGKTISWRDRLLYLLGDVLVFSPLRNALGLARIRVAYTAGAAICPDLFRFYRSLGINLKQLYGQTETCAYVCLQPDDEVKFDSVGKPAPGVTVKIADNGEILVKGPMLLKGYYKRPAATAESIDQNGYFMTGDAGFFDDDGHLKIVDRAKDVGKLANGALFAPNYIENKLKFSPYIKEAVAFGHARDRVCVLLNIDIDAVGDWAERHGIAYAGYSDLAAKPEVYDLLQRFVEQVNLELLGENTLADSQVHRFLILPKELDPDDDELTRTRKLRRGFIADKYAVLIDALYSEKTVQLIKLQVRLEDGRSHTVSAEIRIRDVKTYPRLHRAA